MLYDLVLLENLIEHGERAAAVTHVVFADDLEPIAGRLARKNVAIMRNPKPDSDAKISKAVETIAGHKLPVARKSCQLPRKELPVASCQLPVKRGKRLPCRY